MKKALYLFIIIILLTGCKIKDEYYYKDMSKTVISLFKDINYNQKEYSKEENIAIQKIISEITHENHIINVSDFIIKSQEYKVNEENSQEIFKENNECYIMYSDLEFEEYSQNEEHYELEPHKRLVCDGYYTVLYSSDFYPDYELTKQNKEHNYVYIDYNKTNNGYSYIYKSTYNETYLIVNINTKDMKIDLTDNLIEEEIVIEKKSSNPLGLILVIIVFISIIILSINLKNKQPKY